MGFETVGGRQTHYGADGITNKKWGAVAADGGKEKEVVYEFSYNDLPDADDGNEMVIRFPAGCKIESADLIVGTAWVGGTNLSVGMEQTDGTVIDADGIHAAILTAALTAGSLHVGGGALIGTVADASNDQVVSVTTTGTFTAGTAKLVVKYLAL